jgi:hypothetical protein
MVRIIVQSILVNKKEVGSKFIHLSVEDKCLWYIMTEGGAYE